MPVKHRRIELQRVTLGGAEVGTRTRKQFRQTGLALVAAVLAASTAAAAQFEGVLEMKTTCEDSDAADDHTLYVLDGRYAPHCDSGSPVPQGFTNTDTAPVIGVTVNV